MENNVVELVRAKKEIDKDQHSKSLVLRLKAFAVDLSFLAILKVLLFLSYQQYLLKFFPVLSSQVTDGLLMSVYGQDIFFNYLIITGYFTFALYVNKGKSIGMKLFHLTVVDDSFIDKEKTEFSLSLFDSFIRGLSAFLTVISFGALALIPIYRNDGKTLGDIWSGSKVLTATEFYHHYLKNCQGKRESDAQIKSLSSTINDPQEKEAA